MALSRTTLSSACLASDTSIVVAAATGFSAGAQVLLDGERMHVSTAYVPASLTVPVIRGEGGTIVSAHPVTASVVVGSAADWTATPSPQTVVQYPMAGRGRPMTSYSASGAVTLPTAGADAVAVLNSTGALAMTIVAPTKDLDGSILYFVGNGKAAHTLTIAAGLGAAGGGYTVMTFDSSGQCMVALMAMNEVWVPCPSTMSGTLTSIDVAVS